MENKIKEISPINFYKLYLSSSNYKIIDVREINDFEEYHIPGSLNIPFKILVKKFNLFLNQKYEYYVICKDGKESYTATKELAKHGFNVTYVIGGLKSWRGDFAYKTLYY